MVCFGLMPGLFQNHDFFVGIEARLALSTIAGLSFPKGAAPLAAPTPLLRL